MDSCQRVSVFKLNNVEGKMGSKGVALISGLEVAFPASRSHLNNDDSAFKNKLFPGVRQICFQEINQVVFGSRFIKQVSLGDKGSKIFNLDFKRTVYLFVCA